MLRLALVLAALLVAPPALFARTWHINPDGTGNEAPIQAALHSAAVGDTVSLASGIYSETDLIAAVGVTIVGSTGNPNDVILDFRSSGNGIRATGVTFFTVRAITFRSPRGYGLWVQGAEATSPLIISDCVFEGALGQGVKVDLSQSIIVRCTFRRNLAWPPGDWDGASIRLSTGGTATHVIESCSFTGNKASAGAGIFGRSLVVRDCVFRDNSADNGAGIWGFDVEVSNSIFEQNTLEGDRWEGAPFGEGGAIQGIDWLSVLDCRFVGNGNLCGYSEGGAVRSRGACEIRGSVFLGNYAWRGSSVYSRGPALISGCLFAENDADPQDNPCASEGTVYLRNAVGVSTIENTTFAHNRTRNKAGVVSAGSAPVLVNNSVFAYNRGSILAKLPQSPCPQVACTVSFGNFDRFGNPSDWSNCVSGQAGSSGNSTVNPLFCDSDAGDYHLQPDSPCLPANSPEGCGLIGAYGFGGCNSVSVTPESWARVKARYR
ncbi:MAG: hypothetical protein DHS20C21_04010 [Gemmatimonadota bacterium]|nr:MAG: hypothetical protein DHS20C21_04010 [Gemmatimonadota bacterium]